VRPIEEPPLSIELIRERADLVLGRLRDAAERAGRDPDGFRLVAVTKGFGVEVVRSAMRAGLASFGENRIQEAEEKVAALPDADWHFVGRLQSNKARRALALFPTIHSVDSLDLLARLTRIAHDDARSPRLLLQVNLTGEPQKAGFDAAELASSAARLGATGLRAPAGLMTIGRYGAPPHEARALFAQLRTLRDRLREQSGLPLSELSMGMSADAESAVAEGATLVRVGTALFGPRPG
jgi:PLP dependent protein